MASRRKPATTRQADPHARSVHARVLQFGAPFAAPPLVFAALVLLRLSVIDQVPALVLYGAVAVVAGGGLFAWVWHLSAHRDLPIRIMLAITVGFATLGTVVTLAVGATGWWAKTYITAGELIAVFWAVSRVDALRRDARGDEPDTNGDDLRKELGLEGVKFSGARVVRDDDGDVMRIEVDATNKPGTTAKAIQAAVPGIEALAGAALGAQVPIGRSRAVPAGPAATRITIITKDVLKGMIPYPGPSHFGGSVTQPLRLGRYEDQQELQVRIAGGHEDAPNPVSRGRMGMTRSGKTAAAHIEMAELCGRTNVALMWFDTVKGAQTAEPLADAFSLLVATDDTKVTRIAIDRLKAVIRARTDLLGRAGYRSWTEQASYELGLPFLAVQVEEADDALADTRFAEGVVFVASKGLSAGVSIEISLQRMDADSAPTGLRFNLGLNFVFGVGDDYSAGFLLSDRTVAAGAHPEYWMASKPGYHYCEGMSVPDDRAPVPVKSYFAENDQLREIARVCAPTMMPLHAVDVAALNGDDGWFDHQRAQQLDLVADWRRGLPDRDDQVNDGAGPVDAPTPALPAQRPPVVPVDEQDDDDRAEVRTEAATIHDDNDFPAEAHEGMDADTHRIDPSRPAPPVPDDARLTFGTKPEAPTRADAIARLHEALVSIFERPVHDAAAEDDEKITREDDHSVTFGPGAFARLYPFRTRPWFSSIFKELLSGAVPMPPDMSIERVQPGLYRLRRSMANATHS